jgi:hypothetical protein
MWPADNFGEFQFHVAIRTDFHLKLEWCSSTEGALYILVEDVVFGQCGAYVYVIDILRVGFRLGEWCFFGPYKGPPIYLALGCIRKVFVEFWTFS